MTTTCNLISFVSARLFQLDSNYCFYMYGPESIVWHLAIKPLFTQHVACCAAYW